MTAPPALRCQALDVTYATGEHALRGVDLLVAPGTCRALVGESGSGKTTVGLAVLALLPRGTTVTGTIEVGGIDVASATRRQRRRLRGRAVGLVAQDPYRSCNPVLRVEDNVAEAWRAQGLQPAAGQVTAALSRHGIADAAMRQRRWPHEWSGGMLQRAAISAAAAHDPPLMVADEPTSALDADRADAVLASLRQTGAAVLLITHDPRLAEAHSDEVAVLYAGRVVEIGPTVAILDRPRHPHTRGLLAATPRPGHGLPEPMAGVAPSALSPPSQRLRPQTAGNARSATASPSAPPRSSTLPAAHAPQQTAGTARPADPARASSRRSARRPRTANHPLISPPGGLDKNLCSDNS